MATDTLHQKPKAIFRRPRPLDIVCDTAGGLTLFLPTSLEGRLVRCRVQNRQPNGSACTCSSKNTPT